MIDKKPAFKIMDCKKYFMEYGMKKVRLYLDTSVISHLDAPDTPEKMQETLTLWEDIKAEKYEIVISPVVAEEIYKCDQPKQDFMFSMLNTIEHENILVNDTIREITDEIIRLGILTEKSRNDCLHIGCAILGQCDCIVSWNFKHLVKQKTVNGVRIITSIFRYKSIDIIPPTMLIDMEDE